MAQSQYTGDSISVVGVPSGYDAPTPYRKTRVELDVAETVITRPSWSVVRHGAQIIPFKKEKQIWYLPAGCWALAPHQATVALETAALQGTIIRAARTGSPRTAHVAKIASGITELPMHRALREDGLSIPDNVTTDDGDWFMRKNVAQSVTGTARPQNWDSRLAQEQAAYPIPWEAGGDAPQGTTPDPEDDTKTYPMDRLMESRLTYHGHTGFMYRFFLPAHATKTTDHITNLYLGGSLISGTGGNQITTDGVCINFRGNGSASVMERLVQTATTAINAWRKWMDFDWDTQDKSKGMKAYSIFVIPTINPYGGRRVNVVSGKGTAAKNVSGQVTAEYANIPPIVGQVAAAPPKELDYVDMRASALGTGRIRVDWRRDMRAPFQVSRLTYPRKGEFSDSPFTVPFVSNNAGLAINVYADTFCPPGTRVEAKLYEAESSQEMAAGQGQPSGNNRILFPFTGIPGKTHYYVEFILHASQDRFSTPAVYGYQVYVPGATQGTARPPIYIGSVRSVNISGPDLDPTHETASVVIEDTKEVSTQNGRDNEFAILKKRSRIHSRITTAHQAGNDTNTVVLFEGEVSRAVATKKGKEGMTWPSELWRQYECSMVSMWARLKDQLNFVRMSFWRDPNAPLDRYGKPQPYKVVDIITWLFQQGGIPLDMIEVPQSDMRLWPSRNPSDMMIHPMVTIFDYIQHLVRDYLGGFLLWDPNAGAKGKWRVLLPNNDYSHAKWHFWDGYPISTVVGSAQTAFANPKALHSPGTYTRQGGQVPMSPMYQFRTYPRSPEANYCVVSGLGYTIPEINKPQLLTAFAWNPKSFDFYPGQNPPADPEHPDYLGRFVPLIHVDSTLYTPKAVHWTLRRLAQRTFHGEKWIEFQAPLVLVDHEDPQSARQKRPLRIYDTILISIDGITAIAQIRSVNPAYTNDRDQRAHYEAMFITNTDNLEV